MDIVMGRLNEILQSQVIDWQVRFSQIGKDKVCKRKIKLKQKIKVFFGMRINKKKKKISRKKNIQKKKKEKKRSFTWTKQFGKVVGFQFKSSNYCGIISLKRNKKVWNRHGRVRGIPCINHNS